MGNASRHVGGALGHVRICDLSGQLAGAGATRVLAAFGAEVIRIEDPVTHGLWDIVRQLGPYVADDRSPDGASGFINHNVEKLGITLNLRTERGKELLAELVRRVRRGDRELRRRRDGAPRVRLRAPPRAASRHRVRVQLRVRPHGPVPAVQVVGTDRPGGQRPHPHLGAARPGAGGLGLLVHGPRRRLRHGHRPARRPVPPAAHRRGPVGGRGVHRGGDRPDRPDGARRHRQRPGPARRRRRALQPQHVAGDGAARHLPVPRRGLVGGRRLPPRRRLGRARRRAR